MDFEGCRCLLLKFKISGVSGSKLKKIEGSIKHAIHYSYYEGRDCRI